MAQPTLLGSPASNGGAVNVAGGTPYTAFTYTVSAGANRLLLLLVSIGDTGATNSVTAATYGAQTMTAITGFAANDGNWTRVQGFYLKEAGIAAAGSTTFSITFDDLTQHVIVGAVAYSGVDQSSTFGTAAPATGTSTAPSTGSITLTADQIAVGVIATDDDNAFAEGSTLLYEVEGFGSDTGGGAQSRTTTGALAWTTDNNSWSVAGVPITGVASGTTVGLTGSAGTSASGTVVGSPSFGVTGQAGTASTGTDTPGISVALVG